MEGSKDCMNDDLLSKTMIGTREEAMVLSYSSRFPSRRLSCRSFALVLVGREGKLGEQSELVHKTRRASITEQQTDRPGDVITLQHRRVGSLLFRVKTPPRKKLDAGFPLFVTNEVQSWHLGQPKSRTSCRKTYQILINIPVEAPKSPRTPEMFLSPLLNNSISSRACFSKRIRGVPSFIRHVTSAFRKQTQHLC